MGKIGFLKGELQEGTPFRALALKKVRKESPQASNRLEVWE